MAGEAVNQAWERIFHDLRIDGSRDIVEVSNADIKRITGMEPRIMCKHDSTDSLPDVLRRFGYFILPVTNGSYVLIRGVGYHTLEGNGTVQAHLSRLPFAVQSLEVGISESQHLDYAYHTGLIEAFMNVGPLLPTIRGRKFTPEFRFRVGRLGPLTVRGVQIEVDAGYEGHDSIVLAEAKIGCPHDFIIRQLFYPYRAWGVSVPGKATRTFFFTFDPATRVYHLWEYEFTDPEQYNSIALVRQQQYRIISPEKDRLTLARVAAGEAARALPQQELLVPQADDFGKVAELPIRVAHGHDDSSSIAQVFGFTTRQSSYYRHAAEALGLVVLNRRTGVYELTDVGRRYVSLPAEDRNTLLGTLLLNLPLMRLVLDRLQEDRSLSLEDIAEIIGRHGYNVNTSLRRAQTVMSWLRWLEDNLGLVRVQDRRAFLPVE